eukprot:7385263-Prymnesium_polylepis.1
METLARLNVDVVSDEEIEWALRNIELPLRRLERADYERVAPVLTCIVTHMQMPTKLKERASHLLDICERAMPRLTHTT